MKTRWAILILAVGSMFTLLGCGPQVDVEDLGTVVYEIPDVPDYRTASEEAVPTDDEPSSTETEEASEEAAGEASEEAEPASGDAATERDADEEETDEAQDGAAEESGQPASEAAATDASRTPSDPE